LSHFDSAQGDKSIWGLRRTRAFWALEEKSISAKVLKSKIDFCRRLESARAFLVIQELTESFFVMM
jgi:hypothetical protein